MERLFDEHNFGANGDRDAYAFQDDYEARVKALIADAVDYNLSSLSPDREENLKYYYGQSPGLEDVPLGYDVGDTENDAPNRSTAVSTDVRDTVMSIMPSLMRIFTSSDDIVEFVPSTPEGEEGAKQAKIDANYTFNEENGGFLLLHSVFKDALTQKIGIVEWWSDNDVCVKTAEFGNIEEDEVKNMMQEYEAGNPNPGQPRFEILEMSDPDDNGIIATLKVRYQEINPVIRVESLPPEDFRVDRRAKTVKQARLIGSASIIPGSDVVAMGFPKELVDQYTGQYDYYSVEREIYHPDIDTSIVDRDMVEFGRYYIMIDKDGDGIDELRYICTLGTNYDIIEDEPCDTKRLAVFCGDPRPHTVVGDCMADLTKDIQQIKTQLLRGALDNMAASMYADLAVNETMVNMEDVLSDGVGRVIRTKGTPAQVMQEFRASFNGADIFEMMGTMDLLRQARTGISEASKGVDPKALQSTNLMGIEAIVTGAQERIELIARIFAETGFKAVMEGILRELVRFPNRNRTIKLQGKWTSLNPSLYDPKMTVRVNPQLGKGSEMAQMMALQEVQNTQTQIMTQLGISNPIVTPEQYLNTIKDRLSLVNIKNTSRYFNDITPEIMQQLSGPKEPSPDEIIARAQLEKVKADTVKTMSETKIKQEQIQVDRERIAKEDDFKRDQLGLQTLVGLVTSLAEHPTASEKVPEAEAIIAEGNQP